MAENSHGLIRDNNVTSIWKDRKNSSSILLLGWDSNPELFQIKFENIYRLNHLTRSLLYHARDTLGVVRDSNAYTITERPNNVSLNWVILGS